MKRLLIFTLLLAIALGVFVWQVPASIFAGFLPKEATRFVQLHRITGTLWRGNALFSTMGVSPTLSVAWQCLPSIMPLGAGCAFSETVNGAAQVNLLSGSLTGAKLTAVIPVQIGGGAAFMAESPRVAVDVASLAMTATTLAISGSVRAESARYAFGQTPVALGEVTLDCKPDSATATSRCSVSNRGGNARLDGQLTLTPRTASGTLELTPSGAPAQRITF
jgi:hypothetical protein